MTELRARQTPGSFRLGAGGLDNRRSRNQRGMAGKYTATGRTTGLPGNRTARYEISATILDAIATPMVRSIRSPRAGQATSSPSWRRSTPVIRSRTAWRSNDRGCRGAGLLKPGGTIVEGTSAIPDGLAIAAGVKGTNALHHTDNNRRRRSTRLKAFGARSSVPTTCIRRTRAVLLGVVPLEKEIPSLEGNQYDNSRIQRRIRADRT